MLKELDTCSKAVDGTAQACGLLLLCSTFACYFSGSEVDRAREIQYAIEAAKLRTSFISVAEAQCSVPSDRDRIVSEISGQWRDVDMCISVLLAAGMSTPHLREAASHGVNVDRAAHTSIANICFCIGILLTFSAVFVALDNNDITLAHKIVWIIG